MRGNRNTGSESGRKGRLTITDRMDINGYLHRGMSIEEIAVRIGRDHSTVYRELRRHCGEKMGYVIRKCPLLSRRYVVCNQCPKRSACHRDKLYYNCTDAQRQSRINNANAHSGPRLTTCELAAIDAVVTEGVRRGQSIEHICRANPAELGKAAPARIRRLIWDGRMTVRPAQLRRVRRIRRHVPRMPEDTINQANIADKAGRTMEAFLEYRRSHPRAAVVQLDSVMGRQSDREAILTAMEVESGFQAGFLYRREESGIAAAAAIRLFCLRMLASTEREIILLADNGSEFSRLAGLESGRVRVFFTKPYCACDKAECERNHELFRFFSPKGVTFRGLIQDDVTWMFENINSYLRKKLRWKSPYEIAGALFPDLASSLGIGRISPEKVDFTLRHRPLGS